MKFSIFLVFFLFSTNILAEKIATVNYSKILSKLSSYENFLKDVEKYKAKQLITLKKIENELLDEKDDLNSSKIILSEKEFEKKVVLYEKNINDYQIKVDNINNEIFNKIENAKSIINDEIIKIVQKISKENNIDIVFDANNYVIANKSFDLTDQVIKIINSKKIELQ